MKTLIKIPLLCVLILFVAFGCEKEEVYENIPVQYEKCPCDHETEFIKKVSYENILLFDSTKITFDIIKDIFNEKKEFLYILILPKTKKAKIISYSRNNNILYCSGEGIICNFPLDITEKVDIPKIGLPVKFEAEVYDACFSKPSVGMGTLYTDNILTSFKIKKR